MRGGYEEISDCLMRRRKMRRRRRRISGKRQAYGLGSNVSEHDSRWRRYDNADRSRMGNSVR